MITAIDTSVLLDIFGADSEFGVGWADALRQCIAEGSVIACDIVRAETGASFPEPTAAEAALARLRIDFSPLDRSTSLATGQAWRAHRQAGGTRERVIADFGVPPVSRTPEGFGRKTGPGGEKCLEPDRRIARSSS
ncbi:MAG: hypothetical protein ACR2NR_11800, partial [Solirubrobacteraceae bacterium]